MEKMEALWRLCEGDESFMEEMEEIKRKKQRKRGKEERWRWKRETLLLAATPLGLASLCSASSWTKVFFVIYR